MAEGRHSLQTSICACRRQGMKKRHPEGAFQAVEKAAGFSRQPVLCRYFRAAKRHENTASLPRTPCRARLSAAFDPIRGGLCPSSSPVRRKDCTHGGGRHSLQTSICACRRQGMKSGTRRVPPGCRKSRWLFSTACINAGIFVPRSGTKILLRFHARLAEQGLVRHLIRFEAGFAPSSSPVRRKDCTHGGGRHSLQTSICACRRQGRKAAPGGCQVPGCRKSRWLFSTACNNAGIFVPRSGTKILAFPRTPCRARLSAAFDPIRGGLCPLELPL